MLGRGSHARYGDGTVRPATLSTSVKQTRGNTLLRDPMRAYSMSPSQ